ncbi:RNA polymerase sigma factor [Caballeronia sp. LZ034LL]|uniref:RNA polymerase sigma factor n=1 Tax=Caballeronia sp. LZ034LL TaxID=3038567 RepID=UPI003857BE63
MNEPDPDTRLIARVGKRESGAVREIVEKKLPRIVALATRMLGDRDEADDVAQEAFMRIWKAAPDWVPGAARFDTWLHRVTLNLCYDRLRRNRETTMSDELPEQEDAAPLPDERIETSDTNQRLTSALARLPARQREALVLQYYQELSNAETADLMGVSVEALESLLVRARRNLRTALTDLARGQSGPDDRAPKEQR